MWQTVPGISILPRHVISLDKSCQVVLIPWHTALAGYAARYGYHLDIITGLLVYTHSTQQPHACVCVPLPSSQSAHTRQGCGSLRRRVLSECRVLARLEASPVTRLLGMERNRQGATQGLPGLQAWRAGWPGGRKGAFRDSLFQDSFATTPFALPFPHAPAPRCCFCCCCCVCATGLVLYGQIRPWCDTRHSYPLRGPSGVRPHIERPARRNTTS